MIKDECTYTEAFLELENLLLLLGDFGRGGL
jgi:hypothetical protein